MDYDHRDPAQKLFNIGTHGHHHLRLLAAEIEKCDVVCA